MSVERLQRKSVSFAATTGRFVLKDKNFTQQYNHMYCKRQLQMRRRLRWPATVGAKRAAVHTSRARRRRRFGVVVVGSLERPALGRLEQRGAGRRVGRRPI